MKFESDYSFYAWLMFKESGNPYLAQEGIRESLKVKDAGKGL